jgi:outer membrane protein assembly factor BamB
MFRQASSPARLDYDGQSEIVFPAGDGNLYSFDAVSGRRISTLQCNLPGTTRWGVRNNKWHRGSRLYFEAPPVVYDNVVYVGMTQEFEATGTRPGWPIVSVASPRERGAPSKSILWRFRTETHGGTTRSVAVDDRMVYAILHPTTLFAIDRETGKEVWRWPFDLDADVLDCSSPAIDGKRLYVPVGEYIHVFSTESTPHLVGRYFLGELGSGAHRHCQIRNGKLYVATNGLVWCLRTL